MPGGRAAYIATQRSSWVSWTPCEVGGVRGCDAENRTFVHHGAHVCQEKYAEIPTSGGTLL